MGLSLSRGAAVRMYCVRCAIVAMCDSCDVRDAHDCNINEIVNDEVIFYAHCDSRNGIRLGYWTLYGNTENVGNTNDIYFKTSTDHGDVVSHNWYIWQVNQKHQFIGELTGDLKKINVGLIFPAVDILYMIINNGTFEGVYPRCE